MHDLDHGCSWLFPRGRSSRAAALLTAAIVVRAAAAWTTALGAPAGTGAAVHELGNATIGVRIAADGRLLSVENRPAGEIHAFSADGFSLDTDLGPLSSDAATPVEARSTRDGAVFRYRFERPNDPGRPDLEVELRYTLGAGRHFIRRTLKLTNGRPLRLRAVRLGRIVFDRPADETVHYLTFWMAPTVEFIRHAKGGLFTGIENPFYRADLDERGVSLMYEPGLILAAGEGYESEPQFIGVYTRSGVMVEDSGRPFRYPNGSGHIPIDRNESRAMRAYALDYLAPAQDRFLNINYQFFHPLPQMPRTDADTLFFTKAIDTFAAIGGDMIIFNPLHPYTKPDAARGYWNVLPDEPTAPARRIADHATAKGLTYGFYMGCAAHGGEGNAAGLPFRPDRPEWKKMDAAGRRAPDNCIACDEFFRWWVGVHDATITRYRLGNWSWDPSRGSGMNCHDESHGHIAGLGGYKGWRRCMELGRELKRRHPGLFIQAFYGTKQFGLWGLRDVDGHEVYNEQTACVCTHHPQISDDRQNADGLRFQNYWSMRFRFLPTVMGHPLVGRMSEGPWDRDLVKACDRYGWQYALMSALAVSGSIMPAILPYEADLVPGYADFYRKWTAWAKATFDYVPHTEPFGEQVQPGAVDGYARIKGDHGFVFLFNGNPRPARITFEVGDEINLQEPGEYEFVELYPAEGMVVLDDEGRSTFPHGGPCRLTVPANACRLVELRRVDRREVPVLAGVGGAAALAGDRLEISGVAGRPGRGVAAAVRLADPAVVRSVSVNGTEVDFSRDRGGIRFVAGFAGEPHVRELDRWTRPDGTVFRFPNPARETAVDLTTTFRLPAGLPGLLERSRPANWADMDAKIAAWQSAGGGPRAYHNFVCCRPHRLWLVVPFTSLGVGAVRVAVNGRDCGPALLRDLNGHAWFADVTDMVRPGAENTVTLALRDLAINEFMGPFLLYPDEETTGEIVAAPPPADEPVVYTAPLVAPPPPRFRTGAARPEITEAVATRHASLTRPARIRVRVNVPPDAVREVMFSQSGFPWMGMGPMRYDGAEQGWVADLPPGSRAAIQDHDHVYVWAVGRDGLWSDFRPIKVEWDFHTGDAPP